MIKVKISVIIPSYNRIQYVIAAIDSSLNQILPHDVNLSVVVVNDGSTDGTEEKINNKYGKKVHLITIENSERGAARNKGAHYAISELKADWLLFLDADDCLDLYGLDGLIRGISSNANIISGRYIIWNSGESFDKVLPIRRFTQMSNSNRASKIDLLSNDWLPLGATLFKSALFTEIGGFIEERKLSGSEDKVFCIHSALIGEIKFSDNIVTWYRQHDQNTSVKRFSESMRLAIFYLEPLIKKYSSGSTVDPFKILSNHIAYLLIGAHNSNLREGQPLALLLKLICEQPELIFRPITWKYLLSIIKNYVLYAFHFKTKRIPSSL